MLWPELCAPLLPVGPKGAFKSGGTGEGAGQRRLERMRGHMTE